MFTVEKLENDIYKVSLIPPKSETDAEDFFEFFENIVKEPSFSLILTTQGAASFSPENKKRLNVWFKNNKEELGKRCLGLARITQRNDLLAKFASKAMTFAMPCPYYVTNNEDDAMSWVKERIK